jgi:hypothetical protein
MDAFMPLYGFAERWAGTVDDTTSPG